MTGPELLDAVESRLSNLRRELRMLSDWRNGCRSHNEDMGIDEPREFLDEEEWDLVEGNASRALERDDADAEYGSTPQLRALLRTPKETAALRALCVAARARSVWLRSTSTVPELGIEYDLATSRLFDALDAIPEARRAEIMKEEQGDG